MDATLFAQRQRLPLLDKVLLTKRRVYEFVRQTGGECYLAFSGGKDSTVLSHLISTQLTIDGFSGGFLAESFRLPHVFVNTGVEWAEQVRFVREYCAQHHIELVELRPQKSFFQVVREYGYPCFSKETSQRVAYLQRCIERGVFPKTYYTFIEKLPYNALAFVGSDVKLSDKCCHYLKKQPSIEYERRTGKAPIIAVRAEESMLRSYHANRHGCIFQHKDRGLVCHPLSFWTAADVDEYLRLFGIELSAMYTVHGLARTGCVGCLFGANTYAKALKKLEPLRTLRPKQYAWYLSQGLGEVLEQLRAADSLSRSEKVEIYGNLRIYQKILSHD